MGYYENPPMIQPDRSGLIIADSITRASESVAKGLMMAGERKREEEKERKARIQKLQDRKNEIDLKNNERLSQWNKTQVGTNPEIQKKTYDVIQQKLMLASDSQLALLSETDPLKRQEYLNNISVANNFLENSAVFGKALAGEAMDWKQNASAIKIGMPGGYAVNGKNEQEIEDNEAVLNITSGMTELYSDVSMDIVPDERGDGVNYIIKGKHKNGREFDVTINSGSYLAADAAGDGSLLLKVESLDDFQKDALSTIVDEKGNIYNGYLSQVTETVDLPSRGSETYQLVNGQRLEDKMIRTKIAEKSDVRATGILASYKPSSMRALIDYTLQKGPGYYDDVFKNITDPNKQKEMLSQMLTEDAFSKLTKKLDTTVGPNGETIYWNPSADRRIKPKERILKEKEEKPEPYTYKEEYFENIITGSGSTDPIESVSFLNTNLNKLAGETMFYSRNELYNMFKDRKYKEGKYDTGKTYEEQFGAEKVKEMFEKQYPKITIYKRVSGEGAKGAKFKPVEGYDLKKAEDRVKLALDVTTNSGEKKLLQGKIKDARLMDWVKANPRKSGETEQQYAQRAKKAGF